MTIEEAREFWLVRCQTASYNGQTEITVGLKQAMMMLEAMMQSVPASAPSRQLWDDETHPLFDFGDE
tara:strand:- start:974 stop:1174 length:201 start_codon:yes stop_codon:yes gene_type:complete